MLRSRMGCFRKFGIDGRYLKVDCGDADFCSSYVGLSVEQVILLREKYHVYLQDTGRISIAYVMTSWTWIWTGRS